MKPASQDQHVHTQQKEVKVTLQPGLFTIRGMTVRNDSGELLPLEAMIRELVNGHEDLKKQVKLLESITGVGFRTATAVLGEYGDLPRFRTCRQITAFAGLNPVLKQSADKEWKARISKHGSTRGRRGLYMAAMAAIRFNEDFAKRYNELLTRGKSKMTALIAVMRQLLVVMRGVLKSGIEYQANYKSNCGKAALQNQLKPANS